MKTAYDIFTVVVDIGGFTGGGGLRGAHPWRYWSRDVQEGIYFNQFMLWDLRQ